MAIQRFELQTKCKKLSTAIDRFVKKFPQLQWIKEQEPETAICSTEYDSWCVDTDIEGQFYIWAIIH